MKREQPKKDTKDEKGVWFLKDSREKDREREGRGALQSISGAITGGNGSHLSHLDIWEDLWLHMREGQAEVSEERVLHRGRWHGSDDTPLLQQWEVKGKNNRAPGERGDVAQQGRLGYCLFLSVLSPPFFLSPALPHGAPLWHKYTCTLLGRREQMGPLFEPVMKTRKSITLSWQDICWFNISSLYMAISRGQICCSSVGIRIISKHNII